MDATTRTAIAMIFEEWQRRGSLSAVSGRLWPMHRKAEWRTVGRILLQRSTNHRARIVSIFERVATC